MRTSFLSGLLLVAATALAEPSIDAETWYLMDSSSEAVLAESRATEQRDPASLTKLMTAYLAFEAVVDGRVALEDPVYVSEKAWRAPGSRMFIEVESTVPLDDLLRGLIVQSGNDAAIALAEHIEGSEEAFVEAMNRKADALGMTGTRYMNTNGLPARGHLSTARDTATLAHALIEDFPQFYSRYSEREFTYNDIRQHNRNALLWLDESVDGLKTGYTRAAGYCLVSSATRNGMRLIAVVFGASTPDARTEGSLALLNYGFDSFETHKLYSAGQVVADTRVFKGSHDALPVGPAEDIYVTVRRGEYPNLVATAALTVDPIAPLEQHQAVGDLTIRLGDEDLRSVPLVALESVEEGWLLTRVTDSVSLWLD